MPGTYQNPVYTAYFADPYVLRHEGRYYAYGTAPRLPGGGQFPILTSSNLIHWELAGAALYPDRGDEFWAPAVAYADGVFYLYYSADGIEGRDHQLRVAVSDRPTGPFQSAEHLLVPDQPFSIDAHPFQDRDGQWYLYYSRDFLEADEPFRVGTGIVVDRLVDMQHLAGEPQLVIRPHADWQLFATGRFHYGQARDWYTVEGAAPLLHADRYYCFYIGGTWQQSNYGVAYVVSEHPLGPYRMPSQPGPILRSVPGVVVGPGHNTFVPSPDDRETVMVYHAWDAARTGRRMCIDRLRWHGDRPEIAGPTSTPQPEWAIRTAP